jgi:tetratricopeptide (TPR) repeat protein
MADHPDPDSLRGLVRGEIAREQARAVVAHLLTGCRSCLAAVILDYQALAAPPAADRPLTWEEDVAYDAAIDRAFAAVSEVSRLRTAEAGAPEDIRGRALFETLLERSRAARYRDPAEMVRLAEQAALAAAGLRPDRCSPRQIADLQCWAWAELGNAYRVADDLESAELALCRASELFTGGTGDEELRARLFDLLASFYGARRQFDMARSALDIALGVYERRRDDQLAGRALIKMGNYMGYAGQPEEGVRLTREGLSRLDEERDPGLVFVAVHNLSRLLKDCGHFREARKILWQNRKRHEYAGGPLNLLKLRWLEGEINAGLGELERAEQAFLAVRTGFAEAGMGYTAAVASLDLATIWLRQGRDAEARQLARETAEAFLALGIHREALGAILILQKSLEVCQANATLVESVARYLRRAEEDPTARFELPPS